VVAGSDAEAAVEASGDPQSVFLWLWGRNASGGVDVSGDPALVAECRGRLVEAAQ
jgi:hypothetical protein